MSETPKTRQDAEYEVLKSIYDSEVIANESADWLDVSIALGPSHDSRNPDVYAKIVLHVQCHEDYPDKEPVISLSQSRGLSSTQIELLQIQLQELAAKQCGEVMILELARTVEDFLRENNKPGPKSFYDEMLHRQMSMQMEQLRKDEDKKTKERRDIQERMKEANAQSSDDDEPDGRRVRFLSKGLGGVQRYSVSNGEPVCDHRCCKYIQFEKKVLRGQCMLHEEDCVLYYGIDISNGEPNIIREYSLQLSEKATLVTEQLTGVKEKLEELKKLTHENLAGYLDFKHVVEKDHIVVYLVQEFVSNVSVAAYATWELDVPFVRYLVLATLRALSFLHQNDVIHKSVRASSVFVSKEGVVKLSDFFLTKQMNDIKLGCRQIPVPKRRFDNFTDISEMADMILSLLGIDTGQSRLSDLNFFPDQLKDFMDKCYQPDDQRWSAQKLLNHPFLKTDIPREPCMRPRRLSGSRPKSEQIDDNDEEDELLSNLNIPNDLRNQSRFLSEFRLLRELGCGSFGIVYKAQNRLDGQIYAIKAIKLNPKNKQLNKKMIREVKLLSKLNHENVVRYYNSWIETAIGDDSSFVKHVTSTPLQSLTDAESQRVLNSGESVQKTSEDYDIVDGHYFDDSDDDEEEEDYEDDSGDDDSIGNQSSPDQKRPEPSESIIFEESCVKAASDSGNGMELDELQKSELRQTKSLYIQMQFCEKSTLRIAIDEGNLCADMKRYWRMVREIVEGLAYIHQQDMIHRDLKPVNIFLDSKDRVKIGDFGLATTSVLNRSNFIISAANFNASDSHTEDSHTGGVGTSFYVAPELQKYFGKIHYNKKVDVYSLGIILFEMVHEPFVTNMERCETLNNLRLPQVIAPSEMDEKHPVLMELVRLLLSHDPGKRPTCTELLASKYLPAPQVEDSRLQDFINNTLENSQSKAYKYLISSCFRQTTNPGEDLTYHSDPPVTDRYYALQETIRDAIVQIFRRHGARSVATPLLLPQGDLSDNADGSVRLMTHSGSVVLVPRDLRVPFARFVARTNVTHMRRYCVSRVYKERRTHGFHPREAFECAFDIISSTPGESHGDADVLCVLQDIVNTLPVLNERNCILRLNHSLLLRSLLLALGIEKMYADVFSVLSQARDGKYSKSKLEFSLMNLGITEVIAGKLAPLLLREDQLSKIKADVMSLVRKDEAKTVAKKAFELLKSTIDHAEAMGNKLPIKINLGLAHTTVHCSGIIFDMVCATKQKRKKDLYDIIATGCRYDELVQKFQKHFEVMGSNARDTTGVGVSISLDKLTNAIKDDCEDSNSVTVVVCSLGKDSMVRAKSEMVRNLRAAGLTSYVLEKVESLDDLETYGKENRISHMIWLKESERDKARVRIWERERERYVEKKYAITEVVEAIVRKPQSSCESEYFSPRPTWIDSTSNQVVNIHIMIEEKTSMNSRRTREMKIKSKLASELANFSSRPTVEVIGLALDLKTIITIAGCLNYSEDGANFIDVQQIMEKHTREKKYLLKICDKIQHLYVEREHFVVILYSLPEDKWVSRSIK